MGLINKNFGVSVSLSADTAIVGANKPRSTHIPDVGRTFVYVRDAVGIWTLQSQLEASDGFVSNEFGGSVSLSGDTAVVGARFGVAAPSGIFINSGAAYIFTRDATGVWTEQNKLVASDGADQDQFGYSVSISGATAVSGAPWDDDACPGNPLCNSGSMYIFNVGSPADLNGDGFVNASDLATLLAQWGTAGSADLNADGIVDASDLAFLLASWG